MTESNVLHNTDLQEAHRAIVSMLEKCEKSVAGSKLSQSRQTLMERRIAALKISLKLIEKEMSHEV